MKILVMGGTSFVSKAIAMYGIKNGYEVDIFTRGLEAVDYEGVNKHIIGDRKNLDDLKRNISEDYDYVMDITAYYESDVSQLLNVLNTSKLRRYVMCSTASVYTEIESQPMIKEDHTKGLDSKHPNEYGYNKYLAELYLMNHHVPVTIFRPTYIYGEYNNIFREAYLFESIKRGHITCLEDKCSVQFVYIQDLVKTFYSCLENTQSINKAYNLANNQLLDWSSWVEAGTAAMHQPVSINRISDEDAFKDKQRFPFGNISLILDINALKADGLHVPCTPFKEGLTNAYNWYKTVGMKAITKRVFDID